MPATNKARSANKRNLKEINSLHERCGIYTNPQTVRLILDAVGWTEKAALSQCQLLEPAAGDGAFVAEAARRLVGSLVRRRIPLDGDSLMRCITAFELHPGAARAARARVASALCSSGVDRRTARTCARRWIICGDFLLETLTSHHFTHAVGNPPYVRWAKVPKGLRKRYEKSVPSEMTGGDLFLPFLDRALDALQTGGLCGFICSDRWRFMGFAERFRRKWLPKLKIKLERSVSSSEAFLNNVDSYPTILVGEKGAQADNKQTNTARKDGRTLEELGCIIRVGPALGHTPAYVLAPNERDVEPELLRPWIDGTEIAEGRISWTGRRVIAMFGEDGKLVDLRRFPLLKARLTRFKSALQDRSVVADGAPWFRPIDRVMAGRWSRPKLLVPELARVPRAAIDRSGAIPAHGVYAIFAPDDDVDDLYERLRDGKLATALEGIAPKVKGGYTRCYRRFLLMARVR